MLVSGIPGFEKNCDTPLQNPQGFVIIYNCMGV